MSAVLEFLPEAKCDAEGATKFYERRVPGRGRERLAAIVRQPLLWRERRGSWHRVSITGFPCCVAYIIRGERILVTAVGLPAVILPTGSDANPESNRTPDAQWQKAPILC